MRERFGLRRQIWGNRGSGRCVPPSVRRRRSWPVLRCRRRQPDTSGRSPPDTPSPQKRRSVPLAEHCAVCAVLTSVSGTDWRYIPHFPGIWAAFRSILIEAGLESPASLWSGTNVDPGQCCLWRTSFHRLCWPDHGDRGTPSWPGNLDLGRCIRH